MSSAGVEGRPAGRRIAPAGAAVFVLLALVAVMFLADRQGADPDGTGGGDGLGWSALPPPPGRKLSSPATAAFRDEFLLIGGHDLDSPNDEVRTRDVVRILDLDSSTWREGRAMPFSPAPLAPQATTVGGRIMVIGQPCPPHVPDVVPECEPTFEAAIYDVANDSWSPVDIPQEMQIEHADRSFNVDMVGHTSDDVVFQTNPTETLWAYHVASGEWRRLPDPPFEAFKEACTIGNQVVAMQYAFRRGDTISSEEPPPTTIGEGDAPMPPPVPAGPKDFRQVQLSTFDVSSSTWGPTTTPNNAMVAEEGFTLTCNDRAALVASRDAPELALYDAVDASWRPLPSPADVLDFSPSTRLPVGDSFLLWSAFQDVGLALDAGRGTWEEIPAGPELDAGEVVSVEEELLAHTEAPGLEGSTGTYRFRPPQGKSGKERVAPFPGPRLTVPELPR